jgi:eukaryotic-like serine/threonine-protein kinase
VTDRECLSTEEVLVFAGGLTASTDRTAMESHVDRCAACRISVVAAVRAGRTSEPAPELDRLAPGTEVGRYTVIELLGAGGMGVVYIARDRELDRNVALKVLRERASRDRLTAEAKALAALQHPNVVAVYELAAFGDETVIAMELVDGMTLRNYLAHEPRQLAEVIDVLREAGRGLAAAHEKGFVHRDIKPENILVGVDGRARVTDFGLAQVAAATTGGLSGTVPYMAPEQLRGAPADASTDVYSFGVVVYEALTGVRPYAGRTVRELVAAFDGALERGRPLPGWLRKLVERGVALDRTRRFSSVTAFVDGLGNDPRRRRRMVAFGAGAVGLGAAAALMLSSGEPSPSCKSSAPKLAGVWDVARAEQLRAAFLSTGRPYAEDSARAVSQIFDRYTAGWAAATVEACRDTRVHGTQTEALLDLRMQCLDERFAEVQALVTVFTTKADAKLVETAPRVAQQLTSLSTCDDKAALLAQVRPADAKVAAQVSALRESFAAAR